ncbi:sulfatase [Erythrobacter sp. NFXS35]|uniref:sulfatase n=1 Tax=Erythrobacter sp. NFXS35 TaxID=2818436 RepID=UPI0032DE8242
MPPLIKNIGVLVGLLASFLISPALSAQTISSKPNVLFVVVDDMNDWTTLFNRNNPIRTPHLERLAQRGVFFDRAYAASPACNPSRAAILNGVRPHRSGVYNNASDWRSSPIKGTGILPKIFKDNGYFVAGAGKIFHHHDNWRFHDNSAFHEFLMMRINEPYPEQKLNGLPEYGSRNTDWGPWPENIEDTADYKTVDFAARFLARKHTQPFFLAVGIYKPHSPFFAPAPFFDAYPLADTKLPSRLDGDLDDVPEDGRRMLAPTDWFWEGMAEAEERKPGSWREFVRAYQASSSFADEMIGRLLDGLDASGQRDNTIIVLWSDHGFHLGEKNRIEKFGLWEKTTRVPYILVVPGLTKAGSRISQPVDLMTIYPTLLELAGIPIPEQSDGFSLRAFLQNGGELPPALMSYQQGNHAVRKDHWRYIRYADGGEELYDHRVDPSELRNLAAQRRYSAVLRALRQHLPETSAVAVPELEVTER